MCNVPIHDEKYNFHCETSENTMDFFLMLGVLGVWLALQIWVLPRFGVST